MGIFDQHDAETWQRLSDGPAWKYRNGLETRLMLGMLKPARGEAVLDIGCGAGAAMSALAGLGACVTGIDPSPHMLDIASKKLGHRVDLRLGFAEDLPFDDNEFRHACFFNTLEFVENPEEAIREACRVARDRLFVGILNKYSPAGMLVRARQFFNPDFYYGANLFRFGNIRGLIRSVSSDFRIYRKTVMHYPKRFGDFGRELAQSQMAQKFWFGAFTGIVVILRPRFRIETLEISFHPDAPPEAATAGNSAVAIKNAGRCETK